jgi:hypothetical protein
MLAAFGQSPREDLRPDAVRIHEVFGEAIALSEAFLRKLPREPDDAPGMKQMPLQGSSVRM